MTFAMNLKGEMISRLVIRSPNPMRVSGRTSCRRVLSKASSMKQIIPFSTSTRRSKRDFLLHLARVHIPPRRRAVPSAPVVHFVTYVTNSGGYLTPGLLSQYLSSH